MSNLKSFNNIKLAWIRTLSGENADYRNLQRIEIDSFGWAEDDNLLQLQKELTESAFSPSPTTKIYLPKPSGLLRPITLLRVRDTIVYQAIANVLAEKARRRLSRYYFDMVFSNILTSAGYSHFYKRWKFGYSKLNLAKKQAFGKGYVWLGELDLTSFYDLIDHDLLREILTKFYDDDEVLQLLFSCLSEWTIHPRGLGLKHSHGIPQGPLPSSFIAECVLHSLDRKVTKLTNSVYLRYVDDITIMSANEKDARKQFGRIEILCRELGLVPQVKRPIQELNDIEGLIFDEPSLMQSSTDFPSSLSKKQNDAVRKIFLGCFHSGRLRNKEGQLVTKLNYSLFRMNPDRRILDKVLNLLRTMPCVTNAINYYLRKFGNDRYICSCLFDYLESNPIYDFVSANCLETIYLGCVKGQFGKLRNTCSKFLSEKHRIILRSAAVKILGLRKVHTKYLQRMVAKSNDVYLTEHLLFALCNVLSDTDKEQVLNKFIRVQNPYIALTSAYLLTSNNLKLLGTLADINTWATPILSSKGLTKRRVTGDKVGEILKKRYGVTLPLGFSFRKVLNRRQYKQALLHLNMAEGGFATSRSFWVTQMDNFNQILLFVVYKKLGMSIAWDNIFGSLSSPHLRSRLANVAAVFDRCHKARSSSPVPHAYSRLLGTFSRDLKPRERDKLCKELKIAYQELIDKI